MLIRYLLSGALSLFGNAVAAVVLPWLVLVRTGDPAAAGVIAAAAAVPMVLAAVVGGLVVDRFGRRRTSVAADLLSAASMAALPLADTAGALTLGTFVLVGVIGALFDIPGLTARDALGPDVAVAAGVPLEHLAGLREGVGGVVLVVGPAVGGGLLALGEPATVLWFTAGCSALAALVTATLPAVGESTAPASPRADLAEGVTILRRDRVLAALTALTIAGVGVSAPLQGILLPVHLVVQGFPAGLGLVITMLALGGIAGAGLYATLGSRLPRRCVFVAAQVVTAAGIVGMALLPPTPLLLAAAAVAGLGSGPLPALVFVLVAERIPDAARGRVLGLQNAGMAAAAPVGFVTVGFLVAGTGPGPAGMLVAGAWVALTAVALVLPALRHLEVARADDR